MDSLFPQEQLRDHKGRYCTAQQKRNDMIIEENKLLRYERDKYYRSYMALARRNVALEHELNELRNKIKTLLNE